MRFSFTIIGNHQDRDGNPIPYHRATQGSRWNQASQRYEGWKQHVVSEFIRAIQDDTRKVTRTWSARAAIGRKPIIKAYKKQRTDILIYFANRAHGDPDNILKGINDALYESDKLVAGSVDFEYGPDKRGWVEVILTI